MRIELDNYRDGIEELPRIYKKRKKKKSHTILKFFGCSVLAILTIIIITFVLLKFIVGPVVRAVDELPNDFPKELAFYKIEEAKIQLQTPESREKIVEMMGAMPDWMLNPIIDRLSFNINSQVAQTFDNSVRVPEGLDAEKLKEIFSKTDLKDTQTVSLSWDNLDMEKEEGLSFYKAKLAENGFEFKENLEDYEINLGFWKDNIFGNILFRDDESDSEQSQIDMTVNYLKTYEIGNYRD